jgi:ketosteroid isomerase-like protein
MGAGLLKIASYEQSDLEVRIYGDTAVVIGTGKSKGEWKGESFGSKERFTDVFVRQDGKWHCVSTHTSDFPDDGNK